jgi:NAD(P)-dependent dehydrogenase (short-subunit alcohol dehydrogenase family)
MTGAEGPGPYGHHDVGKFSPLSLDQRIRPLAEVRTPFIAGLTDQPGLVAKFEQLTPLGRLAEVDDIAGPVLFLASPASAMVTGHILLVDGGMLAQ